MNEPDWKGALGEAFEEALAYLQDLPARPIPSSVDLSTLRAALGGAVPERPVDPREVVADLVAAADPGVVASGSGRFFGFVVGGANPAALAADWLTSAWDQNAGLYVLGPAASVVEEVAGEWLAELFGLPEGVSVGFVTGGQMANFTALAAGLHDVLRRVGWDLAAEGIVGRASSTDSRRRGAPRDHRPSTSFPRCWYRQQSSRSSRRAGPHETRGIGRSARRDAAGPAIVCTQVGNVNSGAIDPVGEICEMAHRHVPGCTWTAPSDSGRPPARGCDLLSPGWSWPIPGPPTHTSGSMFRTTPAWSFARTPMRIERPWESAPDISCTAPAGNATLWITARSTLDEPAGLRFMRRSGHSDREGIDGAGGAVRCAGPPFRRTAGRRPKA